MYLPGLVLQSEGLRGLPGPPGSLGPPGIQVGVFLRRIGLVKEQIGCDAGHVDRTIAVGIETTVQTAPCVVRIDKSSPYVAVCTIFQDCVT